MLKYAGEVLRNLDEEQPSGNVALSYIGNIFSLVYFATPLIQIIKAYHGKLDRTDIPIILIILIILNSLLWLINAFSSGNLVDWIPLLISNGFGLLSNLALLFLYLNLLLNKNCKQFVFYSIFTINLIVEISYFMFRFIVLNDKDTKTEEQTESEFHTIGFVATFINIMMYSSTFVNIQKMTKTKNADRLNIFTIGVGLLCTIMFMIQGVIQYNFYSDRKKDNEKMYAIETIISNAISFLSLAIQGGIWLFYYLAGAKGSPNIEETLENPIVSEEKQKSNY